MTVTETTWLTVNGVDLATHAWLITDLSDLLNDGRVRGSDRVMPHADGVRAFRRRRTARVATFPLMIWGGYDVDGVVQADPVQGAIDHMVYLSDNLGIGYDVGDGTVPAVWHLPDGSTLEADVHVLGLIGTTDLGEEGVLRTTLDISIPSGRFAVPVS